MAPMQGTGAAAHAGARSEPQVVDWRRRSRFGRDHVRALSAVHEVFARRLSSSLGGALRAVVRVEPAGADQMTYDDYTRSLPSPGVFAVVTLAPLPGAAVLKLDTGVALQMVDRLLGGRGRPVGIRRPTDLELPLIRDLCGVATRCLGEALSAPLDVRVQLGDVETSPQAVQVTSPDDMVLLLSFRLRIAQDEDAEALITLCYPATTLTPVLERLSPSRGSGVGGPPGGTAGALADRVAALLDEVTVPVTVRLTDSHVRARDLLSLDVGDVLRLDHRTGEPVVASVGGVPLLRGHVGRRGRRLSLQVTQPVPTAAPATTEEEYR